MKGMVNGSQLSLARPEEASSTSILKEENPILEVETPVYSRKTGKIKKKESLALAKENKSMKDWLTPRRTTLTPSPDDLEGRMQSLTWWWRNQTT